MNIGPSKQLEVVLQSDDEDIRSVADAHQDLVVNLARLEKLAIEPTGAKPRGCAAAVIENATLYVSLEGIIDFRQEAARLHKEINKAAAELEKLGRKLNNADFLSKAPANVVAKVKGQHADFEDRQKKLASHLKRIEALASN